MDFKKAVDELMGMTIGEIAQALGVSSPTVKQARLESSAKAYRNPPHGWEVKLAKIARQRAARLSRLADRLAKD